MDAHDLYVAKLADAVAALGFGYDETRLSAEELADLVAKTPGLFRQYEKGIVTGGEMDCIYRTGRLPKVEYPTTA